MNILLDTHIWIMYLAGQSKLPIRYKNIIEESKNICWLSPISIWETIVLAQKGRLDLTPTPIKWIRESLNKFPVREAQLTNEIAIKSRELNFSHHDPADRFIAATAVIYTLKLITLDERLKALSWLPIL